MHWCLCMHLQHAFPYLAGDMRNTTKLKQVLLKYDIDLSMDDDGQMKLSIIDKMNGDITSFENPSYSWLISKAHSHFSKQVKAETTIIKKIKE